MSDRQPMFNVPSSVLAAIAVLVVVHAVRSLLPLDVNHQLLLALAFIPGRYTGNAPALPGGEIADITSFVTYMLVHGDLTHLFINCIWMLAFGSAVAKRIGDARFLAFSLVCGLAGAFTHLVLHFGEFVPVVGASAAISGQMAGALRFMVASGVGALAFDRNSAAAAPLASVRETLTNPPFLAFLLIWVGLNLVFGLGYVQLSGTEGGIAWEAHIGGFVCGLLTIGMFDPVNRRRPDWHRD